MKNCGKFGRRKDRWRLKRDFVGDVRGALMGAESCGCRPVTARFSRKIKCLMKIEENWRKFLRFQRKITKLLGQGMENWWNCNESMSEEKFLSFSSTKSPLEGIWNISKRNVIKIQLILFEICWRKLIQKIFYDLFMQISFERKIIRKEKFLHFYSTSVSKVLLLENTYSLDKHETDRKFISMHCAEILCANFGRILGFKTKLFEHWGLRGNFRN